MNIFSSKFKCTFRVLFQSVVAILVMMLTIPTTIYTQTYTNPAPVPLLTAGTYGALAYSGITGTSHVTGDIGTATASISGNITTTGTNYGVGGAHNSQAQTDLAAALANAAGRASNLTIPDALAGQTLQRGVYQGGALDLAANTTLTLDAMGDPNAVFIIKASSTLTTNSSSTILLINGAVWSNVFWYVGSSSTSISGTSFNGIILAVASITVNAGASLNGRLLANTGAVTINSNVLPVELTSFTAVLKNNSVVLNWNTATEVNNYGFNVERRTSLTGSQVENGEWKTIGFVQGNGNSNSDKLYSFEDNSTHVGKLEYRLKQIDFDGTFEYSNIIEIQFDSPVNLVLNQNYPNPFNPSTNIEYSIPASGIAILKIHDILGREILTLVNEEKQPGTYQVTFDGSKIPSGVYFYRLEFSKSAIYKKMLMIK